MKWWGLLLLLCASVSLAATLDENHALDSNAHHPKLHALTHSKGGEDQVNIENLRTTCAASKVVKSDGSNGLVCSDDTGDASASYVVLSPSTALTSEAVLGTAVIMQDLFSLRPAPGINGRLYFSSDTKVLYRDSGSDWTRLTGVSNFAWGSIPYAAFDGSSLIEDRGHLTWNDNLHRLELDTAITAPNQDVFTRITTYGVDQSLSKGLLLRGARGTLASPLAVEPGNRVGRIKGEGYDGNSFEAVAGIDFLVNAPVAEGAMAGSLLFSTSDGSATLTDRLRITHGGVLMTGAATNFPALALALTPGALVLPQSTSLFSINAAGTGVQSLIGMFGSAVIIGSGGPEIGIGRPVVAVGSGTPLSTGAAVIGCVGCPTSTPQAAWFRFLDSTGQPAYVPIWR